MGKRTKEKGLASKDIIELFINALSAIAALITAIKA